ncbi:MAG: C45 family autoproteolytic acyltransferase/hydrolase, partial [Caldanaerobacter sp.]
MYLGEFKILAEEGRGKLLEKEGQKILILQGTSYEIGYQHGKLLKEDVAQVVETVIKKSEESKPGFLERAWEETKNYIPERYKEELRGLSEGAGLPLKDVEYANIFPELFHCSGIAVLNEATEYGKLLHARILDYTTYLGLQNHSVVMVVNPDGYYKFMNAGFAGFIGSVTGMNSEKIAIGEMGGGGEGKWSGV